MPEFDFTQEDLDQSVLEALERRRQRRREGITQGGSLQIGGGSLRDKLLEAAQKRQARRNGTRRNGGLLPL